MNEPEAPPTPRPFSDRFEQRLAVDEARNAKRTRVRKTQCVMPRCGSEVHRRNQFPLCMNHLLLVWKSVDSGEDISEWTKENGTWLFKVDHSHVVTEEEMEAKRLASRQKLRVAATAPGTLYALDTGAGTVKLGWTGRPLHQRINEYPPHFRLIVSVPGTRADERDVKRSLKIFLSDGAEWYNVAQEVVRQINTWIALANTIAAQKSVADQRKFGHANPGMDFAPRLLPKFSTLEEWEHDGRRVFEGGAKSKPGPKSRSGARKI